MGGGRWECSFWTFILWKKVRIDYFFLMIACVRERLCERWILTRRRVINRLAPPLCFSSNAKIIQYGDQSSHHEWNGLHRRHTRPLKALSAVDETLAQLSFQNSSRVTSAYVPSPWYKLVLRAFRLFPLKLADSWHILCAMLRLLLSVTILWQNL